MITSALDFNRNSLLNRIKTASSSGVITKLLTEGKGYKFASTKTRNRWVAASKVRSNDLTHPSK